MLDELLAGPSLLAGVGLRREPEGAGEQIAVDVGVVLGNLGDQLVDQVLMSLWSLENCHLTQCTSEEGGDLFSPKTAGPCTSDADKDEKRSLSLVCSRRSIP
jgi:hypothetical protein